ncbi:MAG: hypothetical protein ACREBQ_10295, partial [Nitrososphaerales archaeon]
SDQPHVPRYGIRKGNRVLLVALTEFDPAVVQDYARAMRNAGAEVDVVTLDSAPNYPPDQIARLEAECIEPTGDDDVVYTRITNLMNPKTVSDLVKREKYDLVVSGTAGPLPIVPFRWTRMEYISREEFSSPLVDFPLELQELIDRKVVESIKKCEKVRITDPEGTDFSFTNYDDERPLYMTHEWGKPINFNYRGVEDCTGVIAGTLNHLGAFPHCKSYLKDGLVVKVEGGGAYGEVWREKIEKYKDVDYPEFPLRTAASLSKDSQIKVKMSKPGFFWYWECAIGTIPGVFRLPQEGRMECFANFLHERKRAGYIHHGFGGSNSSAAQLAAAGLPWTHCHIHSMFATYEGKTREGETIRVIDMGHLTALDDPEVRAFARKFGNPDRLLGEVWIPAIPGINVKGDYMKDYAANPTKWIRQEAKRHPILAGK